VVEFGVKFADGADHLLHVLRDKVFLQGVCDAGLREGGREGGKEGEKEGGRGRRP